MSASGKITVKMKRRAPRTLLIVIIAAVVLVAGGGVYLITRAVANPSPRTAVAAPAGGDKAEFVFQDEVLDRDLTVRETLEFHGRIYSMPRDQRLAREKELIKLVELEEKVDERTKNLSGGMKRRLEIARGLMTRPRVLFLDEPTIGLDPQTRLRIWDYIKGVNEEGTTIFLTTHYMDEADRLSDSIQIIDHGKIIASGTAESLKNTLGEDMIYLETKDDDKTLQVARAIKDVADAKRTSQGIELILSADGSKTMPSVLRALEADGIGILSVKMKKPSLDDVFVHYTGRELRDQAAENGSPWPKRGH